MSVIRAFIAIPLEVEIRDRIRDVQTTLRNSGGDVRWDDPAKMHITLRFIGDMDESRIGELSLAVESASNETPPFDILYSGVGAFPSKRNPRVLWVGTEPMPQLMILQRRIEYACRTLGFAPDQKAFHAHITLGRVKHTRDLGGLIAATNSATFDAISAVCDRVHLMRSILRPDGSQYSVLATVHLHS